MVRVIKTTPPPYCARGSFVLLRSKYKDKVTFLTQSSQNWICMGKLAFKIWAESFLENEKAPDDQIFRSSVCFEFRS